MYHNLAPDERASFKVQGRAATKAAKGCRRKRGSSFGPRGRDYKTMKAAKYYESLLVASEAADHDMSDAKALAEIGQGGGSLDAALAVVQTRKKLMSSHEVTELRNDCRAIQSFDEAHAKKAREACEELFGDAATDIDVVPAEVGHVYLQKTGDDKKVNALAAFTGQMSLHTGGEGAVQGQLDGHRPRSTKLDLLNCVVVCELLHQRLALLTVVSPPVPGGKRLLQRRKDMAVMTPVKACRDACCLSAIVSCADHACRAHQGCHDTWQGMSRRLLPCRGSGLCLQ